MLELNKISSDDFVPAKDLVAMGMSYQELKSASQVGGVLERRIVDVEVEKGRKKQLQYRCKNLRLL